MNNRFLHGVLTALALTATATSFAQNPTVMTLQTQVAPNPENEPRPVFPVPSDQTMGSGSRQSSMLSSIMA